jgi:polysaccharide biosynthesis/export protein
VAFKLATTLALPMTVALSVGLTACSLLPSSAPTIRELTSAEATRGKLNYFLVDMDPGVATALADYRSAGLAKSFGVGGYKPALVLRPGDTVAITVFEVSSPLSLFGPPGPAEPTLPGQSGGATGLPSGPPGGRSATLPTQFVELDGSVAIPYAGRVKVAGMTPARAARTIEQALQGKALQPQVVVTPVATELNLVTVGGDVGRPGAIVLTVRGERMLDVIAAAGGAKYESYDCDVQLIRGGRVATVNLRRIVDEPAENVRVQPGDNVFVSYNPRSFSVLGSAPKVSHYNFGYEQVSLAEALARSGGANDIISNIGGIYLFRYEPKELIRRILPPNDPRQADLAALPADGHHPVAYHVNLRQAQGYFLSQAVQMRDKDTILVTDAAAVELQKMLGIARNISGIYYDLNKGSTAISPSTTTSPSSTTSPSTTTSQ